MELTEGVHSGRLDAGFVFTIANIGRELAQLPVASLNLMLAVPKGHPLAKLKMLRLRDLTDSAFIWFPRRESPAFYDRLMHECFRSGLKSPHIVQEALNEATILSLVSCRLGVAFVSSATRWRCPESVVLLQVVDLKLPLPLALIWRRDNASPLLENSWRMCGSYRKWKHSPNNAERSSRSINKELAIAHERLAHHEVQLGKQN